MHGNTPDMKKKTLPQVKSGGLSKVVVRKRAVCGAPHLARLHAGPVTIPAAIGKSGISHRKREGDGASPAGDFRLDAVFFRSDRLARLAVPIGSRPTHRSMGWCDDPTSASYNRPVTTGAKARHEQLWREDGVYDVVVTTSHNQRPRVLGAGSAIFLHIARPGYAPTEGCVALKAADLKKLLPRLGRSARLVIAG